MDFRRKKIKNRETPVSCSVCKEKTAQHTMHGSYRYGGKTVCDQCWSVVKDEAEKEIEFERSFEPSEADYQTWMRL